MALDALKTHVVNGLRGARLELLDIKPDALTYAKLVEWHVKHNPGVLAQANRVGGVFSNGYGFALDGHKESPPEVLVDVRARLIAMLDESVRLIDSTQIVESVLETNIKKVKDTKLAALLNEFNIIKDAAPNSAGIAFRTILSHLLQERAKIKAPSSTLATATDLAPEPSIRMALGEKGHPTIFDSAEEKLLKRFLTGGQKDRFDNVTHKPGANSLIDKAYLSDAVELLNALLPTII